MEQEFIAPWRHGVLALNSSPGRFGQLPTRVLAGEALGVLAELLEQLQFHATNLGGVHAWFS